jgi:MFS family permease
VARDEKEAIVPTRGVNLLRNLTASGVIGHEQGSNIDERDSGHTGTLSVTFSRVSGEATRTAEASPASSSSFSALRHRRFAIFWTAAAISNGAGWMQLIAVPAVIFKLTHSATWVGAITMAGTVPAVFLTPFAGVLADRRSRRTILMFTQGSQMVIAFAMWGLWVSGHLRPWPVLLLSLLSGLGVGVQTAVWQSFIPFLVPREDMLHAVRLNSMQFTMGRAVGPAMAGLVLHRWGVGMAIFLNAATYLLVIVALQFVRIRPADRPPADGRVLGQIREGFAVVRRTPVFRLAMSLAFLTSISGQSLQQQGAAVASGLFGRDPTESGTLLASLGIGAIAASFVLAALGSRVPRRAQAIASLTGYGIGIVLLVSTHTWGFGLAGFAISGMSHLTMATVLNTVIQERVPDELRGRIISIYVLGILAGIPIGSLVLGLLADHFGMRTALVCDGAFIITMLVGLLTTGWSRLLDG